MKCEGCGKRITMQFLEWSREPASRIFEHAGNHKLLRKANELIRLARGYEEEVRRLQQRHRKLIKPEYSHEVSMVDSDSRWRSSRVPEGAEMIKITSTLENADEYDRHMKIYGSISQPPRETLSSVTYYRKHGILFHDSGGYVTLEDEQPCSDEEWEQLKQGNISEKFLR